MKPVSASRGFTLIELLFVVAIVAILASIALPSYQNYVKKGHASTAAADLSALASSVENHFQRTLSYPEDKRETTNEIINGLPNKPEGAIKTWRPASKTSLFKFKYDPKNGYELTAEGLDQMKNCVLILKQDNSHGSASEYDYSGCGGFKW